MSFSRRTQNILLGRASVTKPSKVTFSSLFCHILLLCFNFYFQNKKFKIDFGYYRWGPYHI
jgi:hypothetical protein